MSVWLTINELKFPYVDFGYVHKQKFQYSIIMYTYRLNFDAVDVAPALKK